MQNSERPIGVLILNHNGRQWLPPLFHSIRQNGYGSVHIYLVDNCSTDGSVESTLRDYPDVTVIRMPMNLGYCMAYNLAMPHAFARGCEWVIWANNDILLEPGCLLELAKAVQSDPAIGVAGPAFLCWENDEPNYYMKGKNPALIPAMKARSSTPVDVDWVEGSFLMVSRDTIEKSGPLDPCFFAFWEEAEFCRRVRYSGKRVVLVPKAWARHYGGGSFSGEPSRKLRNWLQTRNLHIYALTDPNRSFSRNLLASAHLLAVGMKSALKHSPGSALLEMHAFSAVWMCLHGWHKKWVNGRRCIRPATLDREFEGMRPVILSSPFREPALAK